MPVVLGYPPAHPEGLVKAIIYGHHAGFDHHLLDRNVENVEHPLDAADHIRRILDHQHVGTLIHAHGATGGEQLGTVG